MAFGDINYFSDKLLLADCSLQAHLVEGLLMIGRYYGIEELYDSHRFIQNNLVKWVRNDFD